MTLEALRKEIDRIDDQLLDLYNERLKIVEEVGRLKNSTGAPIYRPEREREILERLKRRNRERGGLLSDEAIEALFLELFAVARNYELPERVAFLGPEASFTHQAAEKKFGATSAYLPIHTIKGVFREVAEGKAKFGVVPIENSFNGIVSDTINCLSDYDLKIVAEVLIEIHHVLATKAEDVKQIKRIYSKDIAFGQCNQFLEDVGLDLVEQIPVESTAKAAQMAAKDPEAAAICSEVAARLYHLPILFKNIEDEGNNRTRFFIVSDFENRPSGRDKTTILVRLPHRPGALVDFLNDFKEAQIGLTKIKSHIVGGVSIFFIEFDGHKEDEKIRKIFEKHEESIKFLGSYVKEADDV
ncbi:chorismate mutase [Nitratifractor salsuginis]|uniref:Bifunctional chorismate mutase/prephenate dehydratase n=1 Tax=Nitratifractor salsuginis (strain DSM 16511 / JCM 12458 / E9I37-1) TaxID=749222 RepID=E6WZI5_NITSE|nr:chorismate mutase [Nitratifractor salsuginis]ADV45565.1 chorismate mutase; prephenate dehydratase [Nitratifractor salsuginis DSM 16511]